MTRRARLIVQNILLTKETPDCPAQIKIADFGLAKMGELTLPARNKLLMNSP
jgi:serine/threonine protein kinase